MAVSKEDVVDPLSRIKNLTFDELAKQFDKNLEAYVVAGSHVIVFADKDRRFSITIRDNGTWEVQ